MTVNFLKLFVSFDDIRCQAFKRRNLPRVSAATAIYAHACRKISVHTIALCVKLEGSSTQTVVLSRVRSLATPANFKRRAPTLLSLSIEKDDDLLGAAESIKNS